MKYFYFFYLFLMSVISYADNMEHAYEFGIWQSHQATGFTIRSKTNKIPFCPYRRGYLVMFYGVSVKELSNKPFSGRIVHYYPGPSVSWLMMQYPDNKYDGVEVSDFPIMHSLEGEIGTIETVHPGDPLGKHKLEIYIEDKLTKIIEFEVVKAEYCPKIGEKNPGLPR